MRDAFVNAFETLYLCNTSRVMFLTGDLGFMALEPLQASMGNAFINVGVAEQNMITLAAGLASEGIQAWTYSIASFLYSRPFEQIRNDVCFHNLGVILIGNGGGFGYGAMGVTHHAMEDYGVLLTLPNMHVYVPIFDTDLSEIIPAIHLLNRPTYLRLGRDEYRGEEAPPKFAPWRKLAHGENGTLCVLGPIAGQMMQALLTHKESERPTLWGISQLPSEPPADFFLEVSRSKTLVVAEEHVANGGFGSCLATQLLKNGSFSGDYIHMAASHALHSTTGDQNYLRSKCGLDAKSILGKFGIV